jgi:hypothetical protein
MFNFEKYKSKISFNVFPYLCIEIKKQDKRFIYIYAGWGFWSIFFTWPKTYKKFRRNK